MLIFSRTALGQFHELMGELVVIESGMLTLHERVGSGGFKNMLDQLKYRTNTFLNEVLYLENNEDCEYEI